MRNGLGESIRNPVTVCDRLPCEYVADAKPSWYFEKHRGIDIANRRPGICPCP